MSGFYTPQPFVPYRPPIWRACGHAAVVVFANGPSTVVVDSDVLQDPRPVADQVVTSTDPAATAGELVRGCNRVAVLGGAALAERWARVMRSAGATHLVEDDELAWQLRATKSPVEQNKMRAAGDLGSTAMCAALAAAVPAATEADVAAAFVEVLIRAGGALFDVAVSSGPYANTLAIHAPAAYTVRKLETGDIMRIDAYGFFATSSISPDR